MKRPRTLLDLPPRVQAKVDEANARFAAEAGRPPAKPGAPARPVSRLGRALETRLDQVHRGYELTGAARLLRQHVPTTWRRRQLTITGKATVDYLGALGPVADRVAGVPGLAGRAVAVEAKSAVSGVVLIGDPEIVPPHQVQFLRRWPGVGLFVFAFGRGHVVDAVVVGAAAVIAALDAGATRWREADALAAGGRRCRGVDWLAQLGPMLGDGRDG